MLTEKQIEEIKDHLDRAQNPIFYYDNDADGLCSFLILKRYLDRGKGVAIRSFPDLNAQYARKAQELNADYIFILDKPVVNKEFLDVIDELGLTVVWIDHHDVPLEDYSKYENLHSYNVTKNSGKDKSEEPVTYLSYKITNRKEDMWLAFIGCIADHYTPDFVDEFNKKYSEWGGDYKEPFDFYYKTEIGQIARALGFGLKDSISNVVLMQNFLAAAKGPEDVLAEVNGNRNFRKKYADIKKKFVDLVEKAKNSFYGNLLFFDYGGEISISADLSNYLSHTYQDKYVVVAYKKGAISNISMRGKNVKKILEKILKDFENATGGGHDDAVGARIRTEDMAKFREALEKEVN